jgi:hypothetical protein
MGLVGLVGLSRRHVGREGVFCNFDPLRHATCHTKPTKPKKPTAILMPRSTDPKLRAVVFRARRSNEGKDLAI